MPTMRLLVGGASAMVLWTLQNPGSLYPFQLQHSFISNGAISSIASNSTIYPCEASETAIGPFFAVGPAPPASTVPNPLNPGGPPTPFVRSYWLNVEPSSRSQIMFNNEYGAADPSDVLILSRGNAIVVTDKGDGTLKFYTVNARGQISGLIHIVNFPKSQSSTPAQPGQVFEIDEDLYIIEPVAKRIYRFPVPWDALKLGGKPPVTLNKYYQFGEKYKPIRAALDPLKGVLYVLTEDADIMYLDPRTPEVSYNAPLLNIIPDKTREKMSETAKITGGDIVWTKEGIVASTVGSRKVTFGGDMFAILPVSPSIDLERFEVFPTKWDDLVTMSVSPDGEYLLVGSRTSGVVDTYVLSKWKAPPRQFKYWDSSYYRIPGLQSLAWIGDCKSEKA